MPNKKKIETVEITVDRLKRSQSVVVVAYEGLTVAQMSDLRAKLREKGSELKVVKNRLVKRALADAQCESLDEILNGATALAFGYDDPTGPPKACVDFADDHDKLQILGGLLEKQRVDVGRIHALAKLPGRDQLLTQLAVSLKAPGRKMVTAMKQSMTKIVWAMKARTEQMEA